MQKTTVEQIPVVFLNIDQGLRAKASRLLTEGMVQSTSDEFLLKLILGQPGATEAQLIWMNSLVKRNGDKWKPEK